MHHSWYGKLALGPELYSWHWQWWYKATWQLFLIFYSNGSQRRTIDHLSPQWTVSGGIFDCHNFGAGHCWFYWAEKSGMPLSILWFFKKNYLAPNVTWDWGVLMSRNLVVFSLCKNAYVAHMHMRASMYMSTCECRNAHAMCACMHVDSWGWRRMSSRIAFCNDISVIF